MSWGAFIQQLLDRVKIDEVVGQYVVLKKSGSSLRGLCPFHGESSPSFYVNTAKNVYYCFGCKSGGNSITFLEQMEGKSRIDVIRELAERAGLELPREELARRGEGAGKEQRERKARQMELLKAAAKAYEKQLWETAGGARAREYLAGRRITRETAARFTLGWAPEGGIGVAALVRKLGVSPQDALDVGLVRQGQGGSPYEVFRRRVVFPIVVPGGNVVGYSARALPGTEEEKVKYLNTPETAWFRKGEILFGLAGAIPAIRKSRRIVLVEGNFDLISMAQNGFDDCAAPLGSSLTPRHVEAMKRLDAGVTLLFDGDDAGVKAALRAFELIVVEGIAVRVALLPKGEDPHSFLVGRGREAMEKLLAEAGDMIPYAIEKRAREAAGGGDIERVRAMRGLWDVLGRVPDELVRGEILRKLSQAFGLREQDVRRHLMGRGGRDGGSGADAAAAARPAVEAGGGASHAKDYAAVIGAAVDFPATAAEIVATSGEAFEDFSLRAFLHELAAAYEAAGGKNAPRGWEHELVERLAAAGGETRLTDWVRGRLAQPAFADEDEARRAARDALGRLGRDRLLRERKLDDERLKGELAARDLSSEAVQILKRRERINKATKKIKY